MVPYLPPAQHYLAELLNSGYATTTLPRLGVLFGVGDVLCMPGDGDRGFGG